MDNPEEALIDSDARRVLAQYHVVLDEALLNMAEMMARRRRVKAGPLVIEVADAHEAWSIFHPLLITTVDAMSPSPDCELNIGGPPAIDHYHHSRHQATSASTGAAPKTTDDPSPASEESS